ncbi:PTS transporter subunit EIIC [Lacticaseibacillus salsurivasis]|uniref:PTS transporter subunit EIIC n=1 Tax=Lacticaseibacillus salsurivasis TaxID=3081441 RepID=UPI0030C728E6
MKKLLHRYFHSRFYAILTATFQPLLPLVLLGTYAQALLVAAFSRNGFFTEVFALKSWLPGYALIRQGLSMLTAYTLGLLGLLTAIFAARAVARRNPTLAMLVAGIGFLILNTTRLAMLGPGLGLGGLLLGLLFGLLIGWLLNLPWARFTASLIIIAAVVIRLGLNALAVGEISPSFTSVPHGGAGVLLAVLANSVLAWFGLTPLIDPLSPLLTGPTATANLTAVLANKTVPYLTTVGTLYRPFALFGGVGGTLGLIIAILLMDRRRTKRQLAKWSLVPGLVNLNLPLLVGYPLLLNPLLLIPFTLAPLAATALAWVALHLQLMTAAVYHVPATTPGPMLAWLATNGNWPALIVAFVCLAASVAIYWPFVKMLEEVAPDV